MTIAKPQYTIYGGDTDQIIEEWLDHITTTVREEVPGLTGIVLCGGYARGEGSVALVGDKVQPINDRSGARSRSSGHFVSRMCGKISALRA